jgi:hypothetical protein
MHTGDVALRLSAVFAVAGFITTAAGVYELDRREKSTSETVTANLTGIYPTDQQFQSDRSGYDQLKPRSANLVI